MKSSRYDGVAMKGLTAMVLAGVLLGTPGRVVAQASIRILVVYGGGDAGHSPMALAGKPVLEKMGAASGFTVEFAADKAALNDTNLAKYDLLMMINQYPFDLGVPQQAAVQKHVEAGKGWVGVHSTGCVQASWPWFSKLLGNTTWKTHANLRNGTLVFEDRTHAVSKNMPASFVLKEEWYEFNSNPRPNVRVLAKAGPTGNAAYDAVDHPMVWCSLSYPKAVYISPGHDASDWNVPEYVALIHDAIFWAAPGTTRIRSGQAYLGTPSSARAWIRDGVVHVPMPATGSRPLVRLMLTDAGGRKLTWKAH